MNKYWFQVIMAAFLEMFWVIALTHSTTTLQWITTVVLIVLSNYLMISATKTLPTGTVYAIFVGLGTVGIVISDTLFFGASLSLLKIILILLLLSGVIGLKLLTPEDSKKEEE